MTQSKIIVATCIGILIAGVCFLLWWQWPDREAQKIISLLGDNATPDAARAFITQNSIHKIDDEFRKGGHATKLIAYAKGQSAEPAHMECASRSNLLQRVLNEMGYRTRKVAIFDTHTNMESHTFVDVWNATAGRWETHDADYSIWWQNQEGNRVSLVDYAEAPEKIVPCSTKGCGWSQKAEKLKRYLDIVSITEKSTGKRYAVYTSRANLGSVYAKGNRRGLFCDVEAKRCADGFTAARKQ